MLAAIGLAAIKLGQKRHFLAHLASDGPSSSEISLGALQNASMTVFLPVVKGGVNPGHISYHICPGAAYLAGIRNRPRRAVRAPMPLIRRLTASVVKGPPRELRSISSSSISETLNQTHSFGTPQGLPSILR